MRPHDTRADVHEVQLGVYRQMSPERRAETALELSDGVRRVTREGIRQRHPDYTDEDVHRALVALLYGKAIARRLWPEAATPSP